MSDSSRTSEKKGNEERKPFESEDETEEKESQKDKEEDEGQKDDFPRSQLPPQVSEDMVAPEPEGEDDHGLTVDQITPEQIRSYSEGSKLIHVMNLKWDTKKRWGQVRQINKDTVKEYYNGLRSVQPRTFVRVLVRSLGDGV